MTPGPIERAIRTHVRSGQTLTTPTRRARFTVATIDDKGVVLLLGEKEAHTRLTWRALEGVTTVLAPGTWIPIGGSYDVDPGSGSLDSYLKGHIRRATAGWVAALLEAAGVVEIDRSRPAMVRVP